MCMHRDPWKEPTETIAEVLINNHPLKQCGLFFWTQLEVLVWDTGLTGATHCGGMKERVIPLPLHPNFLTPSPHLITLIQGLEWAATGLPLPGCPHSPVFCSCKGRENKNQRSWGLPPSPSPVMSKLVVEATWRCGDVPQREVIPNGSREGCSAMQGDLFFSSHHRRCFSIVISTFHLFSNAISMLSRL